MTYTRINQLKHRYSHKERVNPYKRPPVTIICACGCGKEFKVQARIADEGRKYFNLEHYYKVIRK